MAGFRYHISRIYSVPLAPDKNKKERELIQLIARNNNSFLQNLLQKSNHQIQNVQHKIGHAQTEERYDKKKPWSTFTYYSPQIRKITNLFKHTNIGIALGNTNTLH